MRHDDMADALEQMVRSGAPRRCGGARGWDCWRRIEWNKQSIFSTENDANQPLAARLRPQTLEEFVGQRHLLGPGKVLRRLIESDNIPR